MKALAFLGAGSSGGSLKAVRAVYWKCIFFFFLVNVGAPKSQVMDQDSLCYRSCKDITKRLYPSKKHRENVESKTKHEVIVAGVEVSEHTSSSCC